MSSFKSDKYWVHLPIWYYFGKEAVYYDAVSFVLKQVKCVLLLGQSALYLPEKSKQICIISYHVLLKHQRQQIGTNSKNTKKLELAILVSLFSALLIIIVVFFSQYDVKLLVVDIPMASGHDQRLFVIGDEKEYKVGGGLISELRDPIVTAMTAEKEFDYLDEKEEEEDELREKQEAERKQKEEEERALEEQMRRREEAEREKLIEEEQKKLEKSSS